MFRLALLFMLCAGLLAACAGPPAQGTPLPTEFIATPSGPPTSLPPSASPAAPEPTQTDTPPPQPTPMPTSEYAPQPGDKDLKRGNLFIEDYGINQPAGAPAQVLLSLSGNRPSACHRLRVVVGQPDANNTIAVEAYTV